MRSFERTSHGIVVGVIVALTVVLAYATPFSGDVRVSIALVGVTAAIVVGDRLKMRAFREERRRELAEDR